MLAFGVAAALALLPAAVRGEASSQREATGPLVAVFRAHDTPSDGGSSITVQWRGTGDSILVVMRSTVRDGPFEAVGEAPASEGTFADLATVDGTKYFYRLALPTEGDTLYSEVAGPVTSYIRVARKGKDLYIRRIAGLSALDEAVGRATEMGRKIFYIPGIMSLSEIQTIASLSILAHVAKQSAIYGASLEVPNTDPLTFTAARETVKQAYMEAGKPDQFKEEMVTYITYDQFAYAASVSGKMVRERPATNFLIGSFFAESLIFAETGQSIGAIQIAGTADVTQLPFFVTACDYTLIGEELYAASAYLSREPVLLGSIKAQDVIKAILLMTIVVGIVAYAFGVDFVRTMLTAR
ncbi:MAG: DUF6754 domain-containing protein [Candidatus Eisenbacteria bacterium]